MIKITETFYAPTRKAWREWLKKHHGIKNEIWLINYNAGSGKPSVRYADSVEEALCFGWIDSAKKKLGKDSSVQRFSPRKEKSSWSELNKERARRLIQSRKMTKAGLARLGNVLDTTYEIPADLLRKFKSDKEIWKNFQRFPDHYKAIRASFIDSSRRDPEIFKKRLKYFLKMTKQNKMFGGL